MPTAGPYAHIQRRLGMDVLADVASSRQQLDSRIAAEQARPPIDFRLE